jgi:hypothetical protein
MNLAERKKQIQLLNLQTIRIMELLEVALDRKDMIPFFSLDGHGITIDPDKRPYSNENDAFNRHDYKRALEIMKQVQTRTTNQFYECVIPPLKTT